MRAHPSLMLRAAVLCMLLLGVYCGFAEVENPSHHIACCVRSFTRSNNYDSQLRDTQLNVWVDEDVDNPKIIPKILDGKYYEALGISGEEITSGVVRHAGTMCVDTSMTAFDRFYELFGGVNDQDDRLPRAEEGNVDCYLPNEGLTITFDSQRTCDLYRACNNYQYADNVACVESCEDFCYFEFSGTRRRDVEGDGKTDGKSDGKITGVNEDCFYECNLFCESTCAGICLGEPDCIDDCVHDDRIERDHIDTGDISRGIDRDWILNLLFGAPSITLDHYRSSVFSRSPESGERPRNHVRNNELEVVMSRHHGKCEDMEHICRVTEF